MDALGGFYNFREQLAQELGSDAEAEICRRSGAVSGELMAENLLQAGAISPDEAGFLEIVARFSSSGYGSFEVLDIRLNEGWARIQATDSIEAWVFNEHNSRHGSVCDYAKGFFIGAMRKLLSSDSITFVPEKSVIEEITCVESNCVAAGDEACLFIVGRTNHLLAAGLQPSMASTSSIRDTLYRLNQQLEHILDHSRKDHLTGLFNRAYFESALRQRIGFAKRRSDVLSLAIIDIDLFKQINDTMGHSAGDSVLRLLGRVLEKQARDNDIVARFGGDEFVWLMPATHPNVAVSVAQRISDNLSSVQKDAGIPITISIGIASYPENASSPMELINNADEALYRAKEAGRNRIAISSKLESIPNTPITRRPAADDSFVKS